MRRSRVVTLTLLAAVASLPGCDDPPTEKDSIVQDVAACVARYGDEARADCTESYSKAVELHQRNAPRYETEEACRENTGSVCTPPASGAMNAFIPLMAGMMIGRMSAGTSNVAPVYASPMGSGLGQDCAPGRDCRPRNGGGGSAAAAPSGGFYYSGGQPAAPYAPLGRTGSVVQPFGGSVGGSSFSGSSVGSRGSIGSVARGGFGGRAASFGGGVGA